MLGHYLAEMCTDPQKHDEYLVATSCEGQYITAILYPVDFDTWFQKVDVTAAKAQHCDTHHVTDLLNVGLVHNNLSLATTLFSQQTGHTRGHFVYYLLQLL